MEGTIGVGGSGEAREGLLVGKEVEPQGDAGSGLSMDGNTRCVGLVLEPVGLLVIDRDPVVANCVGSKGACGEARGVRRSSAPPPRPSDFLEAALIPCPSTELPAETVRERSNSSLTPSVFDRSLGSLASWKCGRGRDVEEEDGDAVLGRTIAVGGERRLRALINPPASAVDGDCVWVRYEGLRGVVDS